MMVGEYIRKLSAELKENHGLDATFEERRVVGMGIKYVIKMWSDPDVPKFISFLISDETFANYEAPQIEAYVKRKFDELKEEFLK